MPHYKRKKPSPKHHDEHPAKWAHQPPSSPLDEEGEEGGGEPRRLTTSTRKLPSHYCKRGKGPHNYQLGKEYIWPIGLSFRKNYYWRHGEYICTLCGKKKFFSEHIPLDQLCLLSEKPEKKERKKKERR